MALTNWQRVMGLGSAGHSCVDLRAFVRAGPTQTARSRTLTPVRQDSIPGDSEPAQRASPEFRHSGLPWPPASLASTQANVLFQFFMSVLAGKCGSFLFVRLEF